MEQTSIAFDVTATLNGATGIARYVRELADAIERLPAPPIVRRFAIGRGTVDPPDGTARSRIPLRVIDAGWRHVRQPRLERLTGPVTSVHASGAALPAATAPIVAVVYDLAAVDHPELHPARHVAQVERYVAGLDRAAIVLTISHTTADRLARRGVPTDRVRVVPIGRSELPPAEAPDVAGRPYVLAVGAPVPRKGFGALLEAVARLGGDTAVVIVGPRGPDDPELERLAAELALGDRYIRPGSVTDAQLAGWYRSAAVLAMPSVEEGFGLPIVEALDAGTPVVATDIEVFREVTGGGAILVAPGDSIALSDALEATIAGGAEIEARAAVGRAHAARYTWAACAAATLDAHLAAAAS